MVQVGIDLGGSGSRIATSGGAFAAGPAFAVRDGRAEHAHVVRLLGAVLAFQAQPVTAVAVCAAGLIGLGDVDEIRFEVARRWPEAPIAIVSDAVGAAVGAWGSAGGAVVAAGTGVVGFATDLGELWRRSDGWGDTFGDDGGAAWIGRKGIAAALRAIDGRPGGSSRLLDALRSEAGHDPYRLAEEVRASANRASLLASFAPTVTRAAATDLVARTIVEAAARHLADTGLSLIGDGVPQRLALVGGLSEEAAIVGAFRAHVRGLRRDVQVETGVGTPLDGALALAELAGEGRLATHLPYLHFFPSTTPTETEGAS
ncbi:N-acetylglucosamine kinase [Microbacterium sp. EST19A]|uniref:N-acetylglucosamine kinase n=1 Tax=Microbacterium sp. EST19A TaxID=2862681 RepID=UPI001CBB5300|nr:BadF/BadG/BcrA/BcrD ATPase family protein [Microbacterium sp. EST19A]